MDATDQELLLRHLPILRLALGERFAPMPVDPYLEACSLHVPKPDDPSYTEIRAGEVTMADLARPLPIGTYLRFVDPDQRRVQVPSQLTELPRGLSAGHRLTRVGLVGRLIDVAMRFVNLFRPTSDQQPEQVRKDRRHSR